MRTDQRLTHAYKHAKRITFNDEDKFIMFSDVHRGDNSLSDEFAHNQNIYYHALQNYYDNGYTYIELGDGDELWEHARFHHIRHAHSDVYWLLSKFYEERRFHMIYGNHNMMFRFHSQVMKNLQSYDDEYHEDEGKLFPGIDVQESIVLVHEQTGQEVFLVHGHQGDLMNDQLWFVSKMWLRYFWRYMHIIGFRNPASPAKNRHKRHKIEKNFTKWIKRHKVMLVCGHTHRPKFPSDGDVPYFNDGCCVHPRGITGIEIAGGQIMLVDWRVRPHENGSLYIDKKIIRGPAPISKFDMKKVDD